MGIKRNEALIAFLHILSCVDTSGNPVLYIRSLLHTVQSRTRTAASHHAQTHKSSDVVVLITQQFQCNFFN